MSKAFTDEEAPDLGPIGRKPPVVHAGEARYVTPEGHAALRLELERVRLELRDTRGLDETQREARTAELERRIALLAGTIAALTVLGPDAAPDGEVAFATWVTVEDEAGHRSVWRLVGPDEADARRGLVSVHSPVGRALLGREVGDAVEVHRPDGLREYEIVAVSRVAPPRE
jgi:transcription elongation factor GreB